MPYRQYYNVQINLLSIYHQFQNQKASILPLNDKKKKFKIIFPHWKFERTTENTASSKIFRVRRAGCFLIYLTLTTSAVNFAKEGGDFFDWNSKEKKFSRPLSLSKINRLCGYSGGEIFALYKFKVMTHDRNLHKRTEQNYLVKLWAIDLWKFLTSPFDSVLKLYVEW